jgi:hypothetical protein
MNILFKSCIVLLTLLSQAMSEENVITPSGFDYNSSSVYLFKMDNGGSLTGKIKSVSAGIAEIVIIDESSSRESGKLYVRLEKILSKEPLKTNDHNSNESKIPPEVVEHVAIQAEGDQSSIVIKNLQVEYDEIVDKIAINKKQLELISEKISREKQLQFKRGIERVRPAVKKIVLEFVGSCKKPIISEEEAFKIAGDLGGAAELISISKSMKAMGELMQDSDQLDQRILLQYVDPNFIYENSLQLIKMRAITKFTTSLSKDEFNTAVSALAGEAKDELSNEALSSQRAKEARKLQDEEIAARKAREQASWDRKVSEWKIKVEEIKRKEREERARQQRANQEAERERRARQQQEARDRIHRRL